MSIHVALHHKTVYNYDRLVTLSPQIVRLRPAPHCRTRVLSYSLRVSPEEHFINWQQDPQSNWLARLVFPNRTRRFSLEVDLVADLQIINPFDFFLEPKAEQFPFKYDAWLNEELAPFRVIRQDGPKLQEFVASIDRSEQKTVDFLVALNQRLQEEIKYVVRLEPGVQTPDETLALGKGSCRDTGWLLVQILRHLGMAARFVSGYLIQLKPDVKALDGPSGSEHDFTDLHAWTEVYLPGAGWVGLDPTSGLLAAEGHLPVAATPDPQSASPVSGGVDKSEVTFEHEMKITRIAETPRVTKPYTSDQWSDIMSLGQKVDEELKSNDVRLTMGGEPTFVSIDDMEGEEWTYAAQGPMKRKLAAKLIRRLADRFATGPLLHMAQGKWYPGEPLPRWAMSCYWRKDGQPIWENPELLADETKDYGFGAGDAREFAEALAQRLGVDPDYTNEAYEDPLHYLREERKLPINVDPAENKLETPEDRERIRRVFERGLDKPVGYVLPLRRATVYREGEPKGERVWQSGLWMLRGGKLFLMPGDSPVGLRLPLPSLPWVSEGEYPNIIPQDPMERRGDLPIPDRLFRQGVTPPSHPPVAQTREGHERPTQQERDRQPRRGESAAWVVRTALSIEPRDGRLYIFMPPMEKIEDYFDLLAAIEDTASQLDKPIVVEGYTPPHDPRVKKLSVTPDPGVIEVNIHPAHDWKELTENTTALYEEARLCRLGTEKFMKDGRHTGTGGGNHLVVGGPTAADSPLLRRPDLLKSLVAYWLNHPSLSYLFSGLFVGPTCQAPRLDEARHESVYELQIALSQIPHPSRATGGECPPWLVDRVFRHLLTDVTGNTHRAEFCIDKLYAPESATGRLGLLELRAFEMPPHPQMSLTQQLLLRALIARFWREPYKAELVKWGTQLHDRFMLPHFVRQDFQEVLDDLQRAGYPVRLDWFAPHFEFRFPRYGAVNYDGVEVELRQAIEPWHVLGEEPGGGGTVRYVDSSLERLQVMVNGLTAGRHVVACNGRRLPLHNTGVHGQYVAGLRFRTWQPPSCLHPTIGKHSPLIFDVIDTWSQRSVGGCKYHVEHPGGLNPDTFPVNANEAEGRRVARFQSFGHTPGPAAIPQPQANEDYPMTLDLRRPVK